VGWNQLCQALRRFCHPGIQTLGEEYTDIWIQSSRSGRTPLKMVCYPLLYSAIGSSLWQLRASTVLTPSVFSYLLSRASTSTSLPIKLKGKLKKLPVIFDFLAELNLAMFYLQGKYHNISQRLFGAHFVRGLLLIEIGSDKDHSRSLLFLQTHI
jgi:peroxin-10